MIKISDAIQEIFEKNDFFLEGINEGLLNLSQVARKIHPLVEARVQKEVQVSALIMNLSRMAKRFESIEKRQKFKLKNIYVNSGLLVCTVNNSEELQERIHTFYSFVKKQNGYITISQGEHETTCIMGEDFLDPFKNTVKIGPKSIVENVSAVGISFDESYFETPGLLSKILQILERQGINVVEIASTFTELTLYIRSENLTLCFDTLQRRFFN